ncbi:porin family protein [Geobacter pickeringii]|uniref:Outer membrane protein beta-barrel domain-containing protein n=1 Tax=Geobacter pickeringii TaxID=345632 RepID=A0A0B5BI15_9BACT|nr:porin family protein [Geobacter pickeringii]AJE04140.1 hypothetical protein GPICK_12935 [Geobacter pickeringii]
MRRITVFSVILLCLATGSALAGTITGRLGLTGKAGVAVPINDSDIKGASFETDPGFAGGGGLIYGFSDHLAGELDVTHAPALDAKVVGTKAGEAQFTDISVGVQYRFMPERALVPYLGGGVDAIKGDIENSTLDWTVGGHANVGMDYFLNKSIALTMDFRGIVAAKSDIKQSGITVGKFDPTSFVATVGIRLFLPERW